MPAGEEAPLILIGSPPWQAHVSQQQAVSLPAQPVTLSVKDLRAAPNCFSGHVCDSFLYTGICWSFFSKAWQVVNMFLFNAKEIAIGIYCRN